VLNPKAVLAMNLPSLDKYEDEVAPGGTLIVNSSLVNRGVARTDITSLLIPAQEIAEMIGNRRLTNIVMLGALLVKQPILPLEAVVQALEIHLPERHRRLLPSNIQALQQGAAFAKGELTTVPVVRPAG